MARRAGALIEFDALTIEGSLLPAEWLSTVAALKAPAQAEADYGVPKGLQLRDEIARFWHIAEALWAEAEAARVAHQDPEQVSRQFTRQLLEEVLGFEELERDLTREIGGREFTLAFEGTGGRAPVVVVGDSTPLDESVTALGDGGRRRSAWGALQEYLNATDGALWGIATNGRQLRLGRDNASLTRPAWLEVDLERIFPEERFADFSVLWLVLHASRFGRAEQLPHEAPLERWREQAQAQGSRARDLLRDGVEEALRELGIGFVEHPSNAMLRGAIEDGSLSARDLFAELLRLVYRMIFLLTVEERGILHASGVSGETAALYREGYGLRRLRERALRRSAHDRHGDLWISLRPVFAALGRPGGEPALGLPALGGLFAAGQCPHLDGAALANNRLLAAVFRLAWMREGASLARVNWKDLGVEEFGSVYESLLELEPQVDTEARSFSFASQEGSAGNARRTTGSYYTPDSLVQQLLDTALEPVVAARLAGVGARDVAAAERALLAITVVDPACGSGHFLLAAARRLAAHLARLRAGGTPGAAEYRLALRDVVTHCIHGVDRNPMALELARMALWLEAYTPERALGFLDHHLQCGDALLGILDTGSLREGIPEGAFKALTGDDAAVARLLKRQNKEGLRALEQAKESGQFTMDLGLGAFEKAYDELEALTDDAVSGVEAKAAKYGELREAVLGGRVAIAADLLLAAYLTPMRLPAGARALTEQQARERFATTASLSLALEGLLSPDAGVAKTARAVCTAARVFHWPIAFPQIFARGGFDVVLGNPPWEVSQLNEREFFLALAPEIAALASARRKQAIASLEQERPALWEMYLTEKRKFEVTNTFCRDAGRFSLTARGKLNTYALFAETMLRMFRGSGRVGFIVPTGIATDDTTKEFFAAVSGSGRLVSLLDFENRDAVFPAVHRSYKFSLVTLGDAESAEFSFFATYVAQLHDARRRFRLRPDEFALINPNTHTCPTFRSEFDAELTKKIYKRVPVLIDETKPDEIGNPWGISFSQGLFNMASDSHLFLDRPVRDAVPLYEAKMIHQFDHQWATYERSSGGGAPTVRDVTDAEKADPAFEVTPRYWVPQAEVEARLESYSAAGARLYGWRRIARTTDERTILAAVIPRVGVGDSLFLWMFGTDISDRLRLAFLAIANSLVFDYVARQKIGGTNVSFYYMRQLPVPSPASLSPELTRCLSEDAAALVGTRLHDSTSDSKPLSIDEENTWNSDRRAYLRATIDARVARLYGLSRDELRYVLDPTELLGPDYPSETFRVLKDKELQQYGEYRTQRLILDAWDRLFGG